MSDGSRLFRSMPDTRVVIADGALDGLLPVSDPFAHDVEGHEDGQETLNTIREAKYAKP